MFALRKDHSIAREESINGPNAEANIGLAAYVHRSFNKWFTNDRMCMLYLAAFGSYWNCKLQSYTDLLAEQYKMQIFSIRNI